MSLNIDSIRSLPAGAEYSARDGRLHVTAKRSGKDIVVTATADSTERQITQTTESYVSNKQSSGSSATTQTVPPTAKSNLKRLLNIFLAGAIAGIVALLILKKRFI